MPLLAQRRCLDRTIFNLIQRFLREVSHFSFFFTCSRSYNHRGLRYNHKFLRYLKAVSTAWQYPHRMMLGRAVAWIPVTLIKDASFSKKAKRKINSTCGSASERYKRIHYVQGMGDSNYPRAKLERNIFVCTP